MLCYSKWEDWSLTITNSVQGGLWQLLIVSRVFNNFKLPWVIAICNKQKLLKPTPHYLAYYSTLCWVLRVQSYRILLVLYRMPKTENYSPECLKQKTIEFWTRRNHDSTWFTSSFKSSVYKSEKTKHQTRVVTITVKSSQSASPNLVPMHSFSPWFYHGGFFPIGGSTHSTDLCGDCRLAWPWILSHTPQN